MLLGRPDIDSGHISRRVVTGPVMVWAMAKIYPVRHRLESDNETRIVIGGRDPNG